MTIEDQKKKQADLRRNFEIVKKAIDCAIKAGVIENIESAGWLFQAMQSIAEHINKPIQENAG